MTCHLTSKSVRYFYKFLYIDSKEF